MQDKNGNKDLENRYVNTEGKGESVNWEKGTDIYTPPGMKRASLVAQLVKNPPAMWETWV